MKASEEACPGKDALPTQQLKKNAVDSQIDQKLSDHLKSFTLKSPRGHGLRLKQLPSGNTPSGVPAPKDVSTGVFESTWHRSVGSVLDCPAFVSREWSSVSGVASFWNPHQLAVFAATPDVSNVYLIAQCSSEVSEKSEVQRPNLLMAQIQRNMHAGNVQFRIELRAQDSAILDKFSQMVTCILAK